MADSAKANSKNPRRRAAKLLQTLELGKAAPTDPQGSYTGVPLQGEAPVQDADDL